MWLYGCLLFTVQIKALNKYSVQHVQQTFNYFLSPVFLYTNCLSQCTPVSSWSNRPLLSGGDSGCSWVFCSCTGPQGESYTQLEGWWLVSPVAITLIWNRVQSGGYSCKKTQTSSFSCKVYWDTSSGMQSGVTAIRWNAIHKSKQWNVDTQDIVTVNQSAIKAYSNEIL